MTPTRPAMTPTLKIAALQMVSTPDLARNSVLEGIGFTPRGVETQVYSIEDTDLSLVGTAEITLGGQTVRGVVTDIAPAVVDGWVTGRARFDGAAPSGLRQNEQASVRIILGQKNDVLMMDRGAYVTPQTRFLYVVRGTEAVRVPVTLGAASISQIEVLRGLTAGEKVVISNPRALHGARQVKVTR